MSLWGTLRSRLFGAAEEPTQVGQFDVVPGLVVRVARHVIDMQRGPIECNSYVTQGLAEHGQKEMVFTVRGKAEAEDASFRQRLFSLLASFKQFAEQGRTVDMGDVTRFGDTRPFPGWHMLYARTWPMSGVPVLRKGLSALLITDKELELFQLCGPARVLALLGKAYSHYPYPPWSDLHRPELPAASILEHSLLPQVATAHTWSARVVQMEGDIILRAAPGSHQHFRQLFEQLPDETLPFALLTGIDETANACLTWEPGQREPSAISPPGSKGERVSGCFLMVLPGVEKEEARLYEDGFMWCLSRESSKALRRSLCEEQALALLVGEHRLRLEWLAP
jgi:hypothetical protein